MFMLLFESRNTVKMTTKLKIQQAAARVQRCLEDPLICAPFSATMSKDEFIVEREQALARCKCEQELVRLDEDLARLDEGRLDNVDEGRLDEGDEDDTELESFDTCAVLAPLRFLFEKRIMNTDALIDAVKKGQTSVVKMLLPLVDSKKFAVQTEAVNVLDQSLNFAIRIASEYGHTDVVRLLLADSRVNPSADNNFAIRSASANGHADVVKVFSQTLVCHQTNQTRQQTTIPQFYLQVKTDMWAWSKCYLQTPVWTRQQTTITHFAGQVHTVIRTWSRCYSQTHV